MEAWPAKGHSEGLGVGAKHWTGHCIQNTTTAGSGVVAEAVGQLARCQ